MVLVKNRQRLEAREDSVGSEDWMIFKHRRNLYESMGYPQSDSKITKLPTSNTPSLNTDSDSITATNAELNTDVPTGKRPRKQKKHSPDEIYYPVGKAKKQRRTAAEY